MHFLVMRISLLGRASKNIGLPWRKKTTKRPAEPYVSQAVIDAQKRVETMKKSTRATIERSNAIAKASEESLKRKKRELGIK